MFVSHDIDEAVKMADKIAIFRGGRLVQYDTPDDILAHPKNEFVENFVGDDRALKRLRLVQVSHVMEPRPPHVQPGDSLQTALQRMEQHGYSHAILMVNDRKQPVGYVAKSICQTLQGYCGEHYIGLKACVKPQDDLRKVASLMFNHDATWLPCVDENGVLAGQVTQRGITHHLGATYRKSSLDDAFSPAAPVSA